MTEDSARTVANVVLGAAAIGAAVYIVKTPPLRRMAWRLAVMALTGTAPAWFRSELHRAWVESDRRHSADAGFDHHLVKPLEPDTLHRLLADQSPERPQPH